MGKKAQYATEEDLAGVKQELQVETQRAKDGGEKASRDVRNELINELGKVSHVVTSNAETTKEAIARVAQDAATHGQMCANKVKEELLPMFPQLQDMIVASQKNVEKQIAQVDADLKVMFADELMALTQQFDQEMTSVKTELLANAEKWARDAAEALVKERRELDQAVEAAKKESVTNLMGFKEAVDIQFKKITEEHGKKHSEAEERNQRSQSEIWLKLERLDELIKENKDGAKEHTEEVDTRLSGSVDQLRADSEQRLAKLDGTSQRLHDAVAEVENLPTRRVDWVITNVSKRIRPPSASKASLHTSWFSPKFDAAGAHGLQLELQFFKKSDSPVDGEAAGDCAAFLWACKGMNLVYKLYIGNKSQVCEKIFNGRVPFGTKRLCFLKDQINREEDSLRVSVEILEAVREVEHPIKPAPPPEEGVVETEEDLRNKPLEGRIIFRRHVTNRLVEQVEKQVENMRSRSVRRVEWRLEQASLLRRCFPPGEPMCSVAFAAAGVENLQLMFYPCGYQGATDGFCSVFLYAPAGSTMKFTLWGGTNRRDATNFFEEAGAFGRANFGRFEGMVDEATDTILLALEIEEAHQDVVARVAHPIVAPGDRRTQSQIEGALPRAVESVVKMHRAPGKSVSAGLEDKRVLPSLWTAKSLGERGFDDPNALQSFDDLKSSRGAANRSQRMPSPQASPLGKSSSSPNITKDFGGTSGAAVPLPNLASSGENWNTVSSAGGGFGISPKKGLGGLSRSASRTKKGMATTMQVLQSGDVQ